MAKTKKSAARCESGKFSPFVRQCFVAAAVCINSVGHGCGLGYMAVLLPQLQLPGAALRVDGDGGSWIASVTGITLFFGNFLVLPLMERAGRRAAVFYGGAPAIVGWLCTALAADVRTLMMGSVLRGLSFGMALPLRSIMLGEYTSPKNRGAFLTTITLSQAFGIFFVHLIGSLMSWQRTAVVCAFFFFISHVMVMFIPESPSFLVARGRLDECREAFYWLRGFEENDELEEMVEGHLAYEQSRVQQTSRYSCRDVRKKEFYKPIVLMAHAYFMSQFAGGTTMSNYSTAILGEVLQDANLNFWMVFLDAQRIVTNTLAIYIINRVARRTVMFSTGALCVGSHLAIAGYVFLKSRGVYSEPFWTPVVLLNLHVLSVAVGMVPMPNVIAGEVFPLEYRSIGGSLSLVASASTMFVAVKTFPSLLSAVGLHGTYCLYAGLLSYNLVVIWFLLPETRGKTLLQIEEEFRGTRLEAEEKLDPANEYLRRMSERRHSVVSCVL